MSLNSILPHLFNEEDLVPHCLSQCFEIYYVLAGMTQIFHFCPQFGTAIPFVPMSKNYIGPPIFFSTISLEF